MTPSRRPKRAAHVPSRWTWAAVLLASALSVILVGGGVTWWLASRSLPAPTAANPPREMSDSGSPTVSTLQPTATLASGEVMPVQRDPGTWLTADGFLALGPTVAPVSLVAFIDYQCANCRQFALEVLPWLRKEWLPQGLLTVVLRDFAIMGPESLRAAMAAHCAGEQGRYLAYHDRLFAAQGLESRPFAQERLLAYASEIGLDREAFERCLTAERYRRRVEESTRYGHQQGFEGTPTYIVNGRRVAGAIDIARWNELFEAYKGGLATATAGSH